MKENNEMQIEKKRKSVRSHERKDYRVESIKALDTVALIMSAIVAIIIWLYN